MDSTGTAFSVVDLFSGAGGMSFGFHSHPLFDLVAAADAEIGKPSMGRGALQCNSTYAKNMRLLPKSIDLGTVEPEELRSALGLGDLPVSVLSVCPPCTGFSRTNPLNHLRNDARNSLVGAAGRFATALDAGIVVMENARELLELT
jgi:DNA (cytosine-5)-methyltransferase 1